MCPVTGFGPGSGHVRVRGMRLLSPKSWLSVAGGGSRAGGRAWQEHRRGVN